MDFWPRLLLVGMFLPFIPLMVSTLFALVLMRFSALHRYRDALVVFGGFLLAIGILFFQQLIMARMPSEIDVGFLLRYLLGRQTLIESVTRWYPPARWATYALSRLGSAAWLPLLAFLLGNLLCLVLIYLLSSKTYYKGALAMEQQSTGKKSKRSRKALSFTSHAPWTGIWIREWRTLLRTPVYALNSLSSIVVIPIFALLPALQPQMRMEFSGFLEILTRQMDARYLVLILAGILCFIASINPAAGTVMSREGRSLWISKIVPVSGRQQVKGKLLFALSLTTLFVVLLTACLLVFFAPQWPLLVLAFAISLPVSYLPVILAVWMDVRKPKLAWTNPTEVIKQSFHGVVSLLIGVGLLILLGVFSVLLIQWGVAMGWLVLLLVVLPSLATLLAAWGLLRSADRAYGRLEA